MSLISLAESLNEDNVKLRLSLQGNSIRKAAALVGFDCLVKWKHRRHEWQVMANG